MDNYFGGDARQIGVTSENLQSSLGVYSSKISDLYNTVDEVSNIWTGMDSNESLQKILQYKPTTEELRKTIQGFATLLGELSMDLEKVRSAITDSANTLF